MAVDFTFENYSSGTHFSKGFQQYIVTASTVLILGHGSVFATGITCPASVPVVSTGACCLDRGGPTGCYQHGSGFQVKNGKYGNGFSPDVTRILCLPTGSTVISVFNFGGAIIAPTNGYNCIYIQAPQIDPSILSVGHGVSLKTSNYCKVNACTFTKPSHAIHGDHCVSPIPSDCAVTRHMAREFIDHILFFNAKDLIRTLNDYQSYYNSNRGHSSLARSTPTKKVEEKWVSDICRGEKCA